MRANGFYCFQWIFLDHIRDTNTACTETGSSGSLFVVWNTQLFTRVVQFIKLWHHFKEGCDISNKINIGWMPYGPIFLYSWSELRLTQDPTSQIFPSDMQHKTWQTFVLHNSMSVPCINPGSDSCPKYIDDKSWPRANLRADAHFRAGFRQWTKEVSFLSAPLSSKSYQLSPHVSHTTVSKLPSSSTARLT